MQIRLGDNDLVTLYVSGNEEAFAEIVKRYEGKLLRFIIRCYIQDAARAKDLVQDTFLRVHLNAYRYKSTGRFYTWIFTIAANLAKNELRRRSRKREILLVDSTEEYEDGSQKIWYVARNNYEPDQLFEERQAQTLLHEATQLLPVDQRIAFALYEEKGYSYKDIADATGVNVGTVKSRLHRARRTCRQYIMPKVA